MLTRFALSAALSLGVLSVAVAAEETQPAEAAGTFLPAISVVEVTEQTLRDRVIASGTIRPAELVLIQPQIEGQQIEALLADIGDRVEAGQVLARLSDSALRLQRSQLDASHAAAVATVSQAEAQVAEANAALNEARRTLTRASALRDKGNLSQSSFEDAQAQARIAQARSAAATQGLSAAKAQVGLIDAQIASADLNLSRTELRAPVAGVVSDRSARIGAIASAGGGAMFTLIRDGALEMYADVTEQDLVRLAPGQPATLRVAGVDGTLTGKVRLVEPSVDAVTRLGRVRIALDDAGPVKDGMFGEAEVIVAERTGPAVPVTAVATDGGVLIVEGDTVRRVRVTPGIRDGGMVEIRDGLNAGQVLVSRAAAFVREGDRINPVRDSAAASN